MKILIAEDEVKVASFIQYGMQLEEYSVDIASDGIEALARLEEQEYDVIILDIMMPRLDGIETLKAVRERGISAPVLMLTAKQELPAKLQSFERGADDYLVKPFHFEELLARVRALAKRSAGKEEHVLAVADLRLDLLAHRAWRREQPIELTAREFSLLEYLMKNKGKIVTRAMIVEQVWREMFDRDTNVIEVYVMYLRKKIDGSFAPKLIHTVRGAGYMLKLPDA